MAYAYVEFKNDDAPHAQKYQRGYLGLSWTSLFFGALPSIYRGNVKFAVIINLLYILGVVATTGLASLLGYLALTAANPMFTSVATMLLIAFGLYMALLYIGMFFFFNKCQRSFLLKNGYEIYNVQYNSKSKNKKYEITYEVNEKNKVKFTKVKKENEDA